MRTDSVMRGPAFLHISRYLSGMRPTYLVLALVCLSLVLSTPRAHAAELRYFDVPQGDAPHDVAPSPDGTVWYTATSKGVLGNLDPKTGKVERILLGQGSEPHGVIIGPDGAPWITDAGLNAIVRVDPASKQVQAWKLPKSRSHAQLNTAAFDAQGRIWFTGQAGFYGRLDPKTEKMDVWDAPRGIGPYGITVTPDGQIYYASLAGSFLGKVDLESGATTVIEPKTPKSGTRRVWSDSKGRIWVSEWNAGNVSVYDPATQTWANYKAPGAAPHVYAVYVDDRDIVWANDFSANAILRFDPETKSFESFASDKADAAVRQIAGRPSEVWFGESGNDRLVMIR